MEEKVEITEYFDKNGVCIKRVANGVELSADTEPSVFFMEDVKCAYQKFYMTPKEAQERFNYSPNTQ